MNTYPSAYSPSPVPYSQSTPNTSRDLPAPSSYGYTTPQQPSYNQNNYNSLPVGTRNQESVRSPVDALGRSQSPSGLFTSPERKDIPLYNPPSYQSQGNYTSPAYSYPLNSSRSQVAGDSSPLNLRQSISGDNKAFPVKNDTMPRPYASNPGNDMGDLKSRLSDLENQLNSIAGGKSNSKDNKAPYTAPMSQSMINNSYYPVTKAPEIQQKPLYPQTSTYGTPVPTNPRGDAEVSDQIVKKIDDLMNAHIFESRSPVRTGALSQRNHYASPTRDPYTSLSSPLYKSTVTPTIKPVQKETLPFYQSTYDSLSGVKPVQKETVPAYHSTYDSHPTYEPHHSYEPYKPYEPRSNYHSSTSYEPLPKYESETKPYEPYHHHDHHHPSTSYEPLPKYESETKTYEPYHHHDHYPSSKIYEPLPKYESETRSYEPHHHHKSHTSSYDPHNYERENPYDAYFDRPATTNYDSAPVRRDKYVRPLYRNTPEKYRPASSYTSDYVSPYRHNHHSHHDNHDHHDHHDHYDHHDHPDYRHHHHYPSSVTSTPSKEYPDTNATDKKLKKLTLKSKPSDDRDIEPVKFTPVVREPIHHHGTKRANFKGGDLFSDNEDNLLPLPRFEEGAPRSSWNSPKRRALDQVHTLHAGDLGRDHASSDEEFDCAPMHHSRHNRVNAAPSPHTKRGNEVTPLRAGNLQSDTNHHAGDLLDDEEVLAHTKKSNQHVHHHHSGALVSEGAPKKSDQHVHRLHAGALVSEGVPVKTRNVADDGKDWNLPHSLSSQVFEESDSSIFDFDESERKQSTRPSNQKNTKQSLNRNPTNSKSASKGVIWNVEEPMYESQRRHDSMRRSDRKPVLTESFDKYGRMGY